MIIHKICQMYDARTGRWASYDPYGQTWSPYAAMGNNPVSMIDPDGGHFMPSGMWEARREAQRMLNSRLMEWLASMDLFFNIDMAFKYGGFGGTAPGGGFNADGSPTGRFVNEASAHWGQSIQGEGKPLTQWMAQGGSAYDFNLGLAYNGKYYDYGSGEVKNLGEPTSVQVAAFERTLGKMLPEITIEEAWNGRLFELVKNALNELRRGNVDYGNYNVSSKPLRDALEQFANDNNLNIIVTSGDRNAARNKKAGGATKSRHTKGDAVDIAVLGMSNLELARLAYESGLFNTTIYYPSINASKALRPHVHLDMNPSHNNVFLIYSPVILDGSVVNDSYSPFK
jgi:hypothetical protein